METPPTSTHRLFIGLPVPAPVGKEIIDWATRVLPHEYGRILAPDSLYLSVAFFGKATPTHREQLIEVVEGVSLAKLTVQTAGTCLCRHGALAIDLHDQTWTKYFEHFPMWAPPGHFMHTVRKIEKELGTHYERHDVPHITFARIPKENRKTEIEPVPPSFQFEFDRVCLYESHLVEGGSQYQVIAECPLRT